MSRLERVMRWSNDPGWHCLVLAAWAMWQAGCAECDQDTPVQVEPVAKVSVLDTHSDNSGWYAVCEREDGTRFWTHMGRQKEIAVPGDAWMAQGDKLLSRIKEEE